MRAPILGSLAVLLLVSAAEADGQFTIVSVRGAYSVYPAAINAGGDITGSYDTGADHGGGFLRSADGAVVKLGKDLQPSSLNDDDVIAGSAYGANGKVHGFVRDPGGTTTIFDVPHDEATNYVVVNASGTATGSYIAKHGRARAFLRDPDGTIVKFRPPGSGKSWGASAINDAGTVAGSDLGHGGDAPRAYLRAADGSFTVRTVPGATVDLSVNGLTADGSVAGGYDDTQSATHGYLMAPDGSVSVIDVPGARSFTVVDGVSPNGFVTGFYLDQAFGQHGYVRAPDGTITTFDPPGAISTTPMAVNASGVVTGWYSDGMGDHGFIRTP